MRKIGIYNGPLAGDYAYLKVKIKAFHHRLKDGDIVTDDMIDDYRPQIWTELVNVISSNRQLNNGELADKVIEFFEKKGIIE